MNLKKLFENNLELGLDFTFEYDNRICVYSSAYWGGDTKEEYERTAKLIDDYTIDNDLFTLSAWYDISGYEYWMIQQQEENYISIDVQLKKPKYTLEEIAIIRDAILDADMFFLSELE